MIRGIQVGRHYAEMASRRITQTIVQLAAANQRLEMGMGMVQVWLQERRRRGWARQIGSGRS